LAVFKGHVYGDRLNPYGLKAKSGDKIEFFGCSGSQSTIRFGTPEEIKAEIRRLRREMGKNGGDILAPAKPLILKYRFKTLPLFLKLLLNWMIGLS